MIEKSEQTENENVMIPCEFCSTAIPVDNLMLHQSDCDPDAVHHFGVSNHMKVIKMGRSWSLEQKIVRDVFDITQKANGIYLVKRSSLPTEDTKTSEGDELNSTSDGEIINDEQDLAVQPSIDTPRTPVIVQSSIDLGDAQIIQSVPLDHQVAYHKMAVRPKRTHSMSRKRVERVNQIDDDKEPFSIIVVDQGDCINESQTAESYADRETVEEGEETVEDFVQIAFVQKSFTDKSQAAEVCDDCSEEETVDDFILLAFKKTSALQKMNQL